MDVKCCLFIIQSTSVLMVRDGVVKTSIHRFSSGAVLLWMLLLFRRLCVVTKFPGGWSRIAAVAGPGTKPAFLDSAIFSEQHLETHYRLTEFGTDRMGAQVPGLKVYLCCQLNLFFSHKCSSVLFIYTSIEIDNICRHWLTASGWC